MSGPAVFVPASLASVIAAVAMIAAAVTTAWADPLPSWRETPSKAAILAFVAAVSTADSPSFVPPADRIAVFDHDGTLFPEQPASAELLFVTSLLRERVAAEPTLAEQPVVRALATNDTAWMAANSTTALRQIVTLAYGNRDEAEVAAHAGSWLGRFQYPDTRRTAAGMVYQPMVELIALLQARGFAVWLCSGNTEVFLRVIAEPLYGIPPGRVIGSTFRSERRRVGDREVAWLLPGIEAFNEGETRVAAIRERIGRPPILACGNIGTGTDVAMLRASQKDSAAAGRPSLQLLVSHDDGFRDPRYGQDDTASLTAAADNRWTTVSVSADWARIYPDLSPSGDPPDRH
ncbi:NapD [Opitutaceae bacterium TAV5]|nr:NapD [Opitutaceae bacterium TAV5]